MAAVREFPPNLTDTRPDAASPTDYLGRRKANMRILDEIRERRSPGRMAFVLSRLSMQYLLTKRTDFGEVAISEGKASVRWNLGFNNEKMKPEWLRLIERVGENICKWWHGAEKVRIENVYVFDSPNGAFVIAFDYVPFEAKITAPIKTIIASSCKEANEDAKRIGEFIGGNATVLPSSESRPLSEIEKLRARIKELEGEVKLLRSRERRGFE